MTALADCAPGGRTHRGVNDMWRRRISRGLAALLFLAAGTMHFVAPAAYVSIVPPGFPQPALLVALSGAAEIAGGAGLLVRGLRTAAAFGLIALLLAVFPANVYMALAHDRFAAVAPAWLLYARLPLQALLIGWVWTLRSRRG